MWAPYTLQIAPTFYPSPTGEGGFQSRQYCVLCHVFLWAQKLQINFFWTVNMTFLARWGGESDFLKMLPKFKMATRGQL